MTDMRVDIDFVGESVNSVNAAERLDVSLKHLAEVALQVSKALSEVELPASNVASSVVGMKTMERGLNSLENQAQRTRRQLNEVTITNLPLIGGGFAARGASGRFVSNQPDWAAVRVAMQNVKFAPGQVAKNRAESKVIAEGIENIGDAAKRSRHQIMELALGRAVISGGSGRGGGFDSFLFGKSGSGASTQSLGAIVPGGAKATGPALLAAVTAAVTAIAPLLPAVTSSLAAVPALAVAGVGAIGTLALAFHGLGKAIDGDKKAFDALDPQAQKFVQTIRSIIPWVHSLSHIALHELAPSLTKALHEALSPAMVATLERGIQSMAKSLGAAAVQWGKLFGSAGFSAAFGALLQAGAGWMQKLSDATLHFFDAMVHLGQAAIPFVDWMTKGIDQGARLLDTWVKGAQASGRLTKAINAGKEAFRLIGGLIVALSKALYELVRALAPAGKLIDEALISALKSLAGWLKENRKVLIDITTGAVTAFIGVLRVLGPIVNGLFQALNKVVHALGGWTDAFRVLIGLGIAKMVAGIASTIMLKLIPAEVLAGSTMAGLAGPWGIILGLTAAILVTWLQIVDAINNAGVASTTKFASGGAASHKFANADQAADYQTYAQMRAIAANPNRSKSDRAKATKVASDLAKQNPSFANEYAKDNAARAVKDDRPRAHVAKSGPHKGKVVYTLKSGQEVLAKPGTDVGTILPGSVSTPGSPTASTAGVSWRGQVAGLDGGFKNKLAAAVKAAGGTAINVTSGKRSDATHPGGPTNHGVPNSNHLTGHAADGYALIRGAWVPLGQMPINYSKYGLRSGDQPGFYQGDRDPLHVDDGTNVKGPGTTDPFTTAPAFDKNLGPKPPKPKKPSIASEASRRGGALAALKDIARARALGREVAILGVHTATHTIQGVTVTETVGKSLSKQDAHLKKQIAVWEKQLAADRRFLLTHKHLTTKMVANIKERDREIAAAIAAGKRRIDKEVSDRADAFDAAWQKLTDRAMKQFDDQTDTIMEKFDEDAAKIKTPHELLIEALQNKNVEKDLDQAIADAKKNWDDAIAGIGADTAQTTLDRITEVIGRFGLAMAVDKAQAAILGGGTMNFGPQFLKELQEAATPIPGTVDQRAIDDAKRAYEDAVDAKQIYLWTPLANQERDALDKSTRALRKKLEDDRAILREKLGDQLDEWGKYWKGVGATAGQAYAIFDQVWFNLTGHHLPPLAGAANTSTAGSSGSAGGGPTTTGTHVPGTPITSVSSFQQATGTAASASNTEPSGSPGLPVPQPNPGGPGASAVGGTGKAGAVASVWGVNSAPPDFGNIAAAGAGFVIQANDPDGQKYRAQALAANVPYSVQVVAAQDDTPESFAARVAAAKAQYPDASSFVLDIEQKPEKDAAWNAAAAPLAAAAAGGTPLTVSNEPNQDINYGSWANVGADFMVQAYGGPVPDADGRGGQHYIDFDVYDVVARVIANGVAPARVIPVIHPGQDLGRYKKDSPPGVSGRYSVYGVVPLAPTTPAAATSGATNTGHHGASGSIIDATLASIAETTNTPVDQLSPAIVQAVNNAATTTEAPLQVFNGPRGSGIKMMAEGGILTRPTLMVGGEDGPEGFMRLSDPRAKNMLGGDGGPITIVLSGVVALDDRIDARIEGSSRQVALKIGRDADTRARERRIT